MIIPKTKKRFCPTCRKQTEQKVTIAKTSGKRGKLGKGRRKLKKMEHGYRGFPYAKIEHGTKYGAKTSKKVVLVFQCSVCKKKNLWKKGKRSKKVMLK